MPFDAEKDKNAFVLSDIFRGVVCNSTKIFLEVRSTAETVKGGSFTLLNATKPDARPRPRNIVNVICQPEDEVIPVKKKLLRPCIALASAVCEV